MMRVAIACDHAGVTLKQHLIGLLRARGHEVLDLGTHGPESVDYPDYALKVAEEVSAGRASTGILICGTGIGMSLAANKVPGIRAAVATDPYVARMARAHNDANVLCLGARVIGEGLAEEIVDTWLATGAEGGRHALRVEKIRRIEQRYLRCEEYPQTPIAKV
ncbi:MAG: ribose 5-phosphate isomerase B [Anaerolineae bacterium]|nr:ribose 5-phosphate isomerase B [Anaerolineae bacterium]